MCHLNYEMFIEKTHVLFRIDPHKLKFKPMWGRVLTRYQIGYMHIYTHWVLLFQKPKTPSYLTFSRS